MNVKQILLITSLFIAPTINAENPFENIPENMSSEEFNKRIRGNDFSKHTERFVIHLEVERTQDDSFDHNNQEWQETVQAFSDLFAQKSDDISKEEALHKLFCLIEKGYALILNNPEHKGHAVIRAVGGDNWLGVQNEFNLEQEV